MAQDLAPLPQPGLSIYPASKTRDIHYQRSQGLLGSRFEISYLCPSGEALAPFLELIEEKTKQISFKTMQGQEVMRIVKQPHTWSGDEYQGMKSEGNEAWHLTLKTTWSTEYRM
jgi:hypothetical protein